MTLTLDLTPAEEERLRREASRRGQEMTDYARAVLLPPEESDLPAPEESLYEALKDQIGDFHSGGDGTLSQNTGAAFTEYLVEKHRAGKL